VYLLKTAGVFKPLYEKQAYMPALAGGALGAGLGAIAGESLANEHDDEDQRYGARMGLLAGGALGALAPLATQWQQKATQPSPDVARQAVIDRPLTPQRNRIEQGVAEVGDYLNSRFAPGPEGPGRGSAIAAAAGGASMLDAGSLLTNKLRKRNVMDLPHQSAYIPDVVNKFHLAQAGGTPTPDALARMRSGLGLTHEQAGTWPAASPAKGPKPGAGGGVGGAPANVGRVNFGPLAMAAAPTNAADAAKMQQMRAANPQLNTAATAYQNAVSAYSKSQGDPALRTAMQDAERNLRLQFNADQLKRNKILRTPNAAIPSYTPGSEGLAPSIRKYLEDPKGGAHVFGDKPPVVRLGRKFLGMSFDPAGWAPRTIEALGGER